LLRSVSKNLRNSGNDASSPFTRFARSLAAASVANVQNINVLPMNFNMMHHVGALREKYSTFPALLRQNLPRITYFPFTEAFTF
jgi:hypothetical protein